MAFCQNLKYMNANNNLDKTNMMKKIIALSLIVLISQLMSSCNMQSKLKNALSTRQKTITKNVTATVETKHRAYDPNDDSVDDMAIWINKKDRNKSIVIGTDKNSGVAVYDLKGKMLHFYETGATNNVDVRYNFPFSNDTIDIVALTNRKRNSIQIFKINKESFELELIGEEILNADFGDVYGFCLYHNDSLNKFSAFVNTKKGAVAQFVFESNNDSITFKEQIRISKNNIVEGMVADDENNIVYIAEEDYGVWKQKIINNKMEQKGAVITESIVADNANIVDDIEGLTIYKASNNKGYLILSSQGNSSYAVFNRNAPNNYLGSFYISDGKIDGTEETDGIDVCNLSFTDFPEGIFMVQDGINSDDSAFAAQNFKYIRWGDIARRFEPHLIIDTNSKH